MKKLSVLTGLATLFLVACSPARMALEHEDWKQKEPLAVSGKRGLFTREKLQFGNYYTTSVKRSWTRGSSSRWGLGSGNPSRYDYTNLIAVEYTRRKQTIRFSLTDDHNNQSEVFCVSKFNATELSVGNRPNSIVNIGLDVAGFLSGNSNSTYYVQIYTRENEKPWEMLIDNIQSQVRARTYTGYLGFSNEEYYSIHPVYKMESKDGKSGNTLFGMVGFEFRDKDGKPAAAVSLLNKGTVYLQPLTPDRRFLLANACASLLMQDQLD